MSKSILTFLLINCCFLFSQNTKYVLDAEGKISDMHTLYKKYPDNSMEFRIVKDSGKVLQITAPKYSTYKVDYNTIKTEISHITNQSYNDSTTFVFMYFYKDDDSTSLTRNNKFNEESDFKSFFIEMKKSVYKKYPNVISFLLFEKGITFPNYDKTPSKKEVFFSDKEGFFKNNLFKKSIISGSHCVIKPNGETVVLNGENRLDYMAEHLKAENWILFFSNKE